MFDKNKAATTSLLNQKLVSTKLPAVIEVPSNYLLVQNYERNKRNYI